MKYSFCNILKFKPAIYCFIFSSMAMLFTGCSSKITRTKKPTTTIEAKPVEQPNKADKDSKPTKQRFTEAGISLLLPFKLNDINLKTASKEEVEKHAMPIDFYQGFKLGIDSASTFGLNFRLNIFDTEDSESKLAKLVNSGKLDKSNLIIGPVFPKGLSAVTSYSVAKNAIIVSPLAASNPSDFNNPNLVSIVNSLDLHALKIAKYIADHYNPSKTIVVIINTKKSEDESFAIPIKNFFKGFYEKQFVVQEYISTYAFERSMVKGKRYAVILTSTDRSFVLPTINKLFKLKNSVNALYDINLFGHPNWSRQNYPADVLENLNTIITASYKIDYKSANVVRFIKNYRYRYGFEPGEYAFKGFDIGFYFGRLLNKYGEDYRQYITTEKYKGLHNNFSFIQNDKTGYINTDLILLQFRNLSLEVVQ